MEDLSHFNCKFYDVASLRKNTIVKTLNYYFKLFNKKNREIKKKTFETNIKHFL